MKPIYINETPDGMSFSAGFTTGAMLASMYQDEPYMVFDLDKAKSICSRIMKKEISKVEGGLDGDWDCNHSVIYERKRWRTEFDFHRGSTWATPIIRIYYKDKTNECYECYSLEKDSK